MKIIVFATKEQKIDCLKMTKEVTGRWRIGQKASQSLIHGHLYLHGALYIVLRKFTHPCNMIKGSFVLLIAIIKIWDFSIRVLSVTFFCCCTFKSSLYPCTVQPSPAIIISGCSRHNNFCRVCETHIKAVHMDLCYNFGWTDRNSSEGFSILGSMRCWTLALCSDFTLRTFCLLRPWDTLDFSSDRKRHLLTDRQPRIFF